MGNYIYIYFLALLRRPRNSDTPGEFSTLSTQIVSKYQSLIKKKKSKAPWKVFDSKAAPGKTQMS